jgi:hypothetical protein
MSKPVKRLANDKLIPNRETKLSLIFNADANTRTTVHGR